MRECMNNVRDLINARAKCIWLNTYEEDQVIKNIREVSLSLKEPMSIYTFSFVSGLQKISLMKDAIGKLDSDWNIGALMQRIGQITRGDILSEEERELLEELKEEGRETIDDKNNIIILKDIHLILGSPDIVRGIRDIVESKYINYNTIIVTSPLTDIPLEHEKIFTVVDFETPDTETITKIVDAANRVAIRTEDLIALSPEEREMIINACKGLTQEEISHILKISLVKHKKISVDEVSNYKIELIKKSNVLDYKLPSSKLSDIGGNEAFKIWVEEVVDAMTPEAQAFGCVKPKGYLALGIPGAAKTMLAEALASELSLPFLKLDMSKILDSKVGSSEKNMAQAVKMIKATAPCVLLIDEIEKTLSDGSNGSSDGGTMQRAIGAVLEFLASDHGVFVVMTSNDVSRMPPELTRAGRLDAIWYFGLPTKKEREEIFNIHFNKFNRLLSPSMLKFAAEESNDFTGAEIKEAVISSIRKSFNRYKKDGNKDIAEQDIRQACAEVIPIARSSKEKIAALEDYAKSRARFSNKVLNEFGCNKAANKEISGILTVGDLNRR